MQVFFRKKMKKFPVFAVGLVFGLIVFSRIIRKRDFPVLRLKRLYALSNQIQYLLIDRTPFKFCNITQLVMKGGVNFNS